MHCCARNIERLTRIPKLRTDLQSRILSWLLLPFCQDLESFAHVLVAFFNICGCGKITDNLSEASRLVFSGSDLQEAIWDLRLDRATRGNESLDIFTWPIMFPSRTIRANSASTTWFTGIVSEQSQQKHAATRATRVLCRGTQNTHS
jgi:hypothetical protein